MTSSWVTMDKPANGGHRNHGDARELLRYAHPSVENRRPQHILPTENPRPSPQDPRINVHWRLGLPHSRDATPSVLPTIPITKDRSHDPAVSFPEAC